MIQNVIDFAPGLHGHFLELVLNRYVFGVASTVDSVFHSSGSVHGINSDSQYQNNKRIHRGHFSAFDIAFPDTVKKIVFIKHDADLDFVLLTNIYYRCHPDAVHQNDFNAKDIEKMQASMMYSGTDAELRNNWYTKLMERHFDLTDKVPVTQVPVHEFVFAKFFSLADFLAEINRTAHFLQYSFQYNSTLADLWHEFIDRNQGLALYQQGLQMFDAICTGVDQTIPNDWKLHAFINSKLSRAFDIHDEPALFGTASYPSSTAKVHDIMMDNIKNFDNRW